MDLKHQSARSGVKRDTDGRSWWLFSTWILATVWFVLLTWWCYRDSQTLFIAHVEGVGAETYARLVVETDEGWQEEHPYWFPAYTLRGGSGTVEFRVQPGEYKGFRLALERGTATEGGFVSRVAKESIPAVQQWELLSDGVDVVSVPDSRPRNVPTWQWQSTEPVVIGRQEYGEWLGPVAIRAVLLGLSLAAVSLLLYGVICARERWMEVVSNRWDNFGKRWKGRCNGWQLLLAIILVAVLWYSPEWFRRYNGQEMFLRLEMTSSASSTAQIFFRDKGGFREDKSTLEHVVGDNLKQTLFFPLGRDRLRGLRFDPLMTAGDFAIYSADVVTVDGSLIYKIPLSEIDPGRDAVQIQRFHFDEQAGCWRITTEEGAWDPSFTLLNLKKNSIHYLPWVSALGQIMLWVILSVFLLLAIVRAFPFRWQSAKFVRALGHPLLTRLLLAVAGTIVLLLPIHYFLKAFQGEAAYLEMGATASENLVGSWSFRSGRDSFFHHDYRFSLKSGERRTFYIALPRSKVHHYKLEFNGEDKDSRVQIDSMVFLVPSRDIVTNLLVDHEGFHWVSRPEKSDQKAWEFDVAAQGTTRFHLEDETFVLELQPFWIRLLIGGGLLASCFFVLWNVPLGSRGHVERGNRAAKVFLVMMGVFGMIFVWLTPPYQTPDETRWLDRAWHLSEGNLFPENNEELQLAGGNVPNSFRTVYRIVSADIPFNPHRKTNLERWKEANEVPLHAEDTFFARMGDNTHSLFPYVPQAVGFQVGKWFDLTPLELTYAARIANLLLSALVVFLAIRLLPFMSWTILVLFLSPIMVFLFGSGNHDPVTNGLALLFVAVVLWLRERGKAIGWWQCIGLVVLISLLIASKFVYVTLAGLLLVLPVRLFRGSCDRWIKIGVTWGAMILITLGWLGMGMLSEYPSFDYDRPDVDQSLNKALLVQQPDRIVDWIGNSLAYDKELWLEQFVGILGWLDTPLPDVIHLVWWLALSAAFLADMGANSWRPGWWTRGWLLALLMIILSVIILLFFLIYTRPGLERIQGIQGRYLYPLLPLVIAMLSFRCTSLQNAVPWLRRFAVLGVALSLLMTILLLRFRYWDL